MNLLIVGAGGQGRCCLDIARDMNIFNKISFLDDQNINKVINDCKVIGSIDEMSSYYPEYTHIHIAIGNNSVRNKLLLQAKELGYSTPVLQHSSSVVSKYATIGEGSVLFPHAVIEANAVIGKGCIITANTTINHDATLNECVLVNTGTVIRPNTVINQYVSIGSHCLITMNKQIDKDDNICRIINNFEGQNIEKDKIETFTRNIEKVFRFVIKRDGKNNTITHAANIVFSGDGKRYLIDSSLAAYEYLFVKDLALNSESERKYNVDLFEIQKIVPGCDLTKIYSVQEGACCKL